MYILLAAFLFVLGTLIGSFLNVIALRYNTGLSPASGRSRCFSCGKTLTWLELLPLASFIIQKGKCRGCKTKISWQYPAVELLTGILFLGLYLKFPFRPLLGGAQVEPRILLLFLADFIYHLVAFSILVVIVIYDLRHKIIPDLFSYTFIALALTRFAIVLAITGTLSRLNVYNLLAGPIFFIIFFLIWLLSRGRAMGFGDAKLVLGIGLFLGLVSGTSALIIGFWSGAIVGVGMILINRYAPKLFGLLHIQGLNRMRKGLTMKSELPFAPFLIFGFFVAFFFPIDILNLGIILSLTTL